MSIEAQAIGKLLTEIDAAFGMIEDGAALQRIDEARVEAKYWLTPVQTFRDKLYAVWEKNPEWTRSRFLEYVRDDEMEGDAHLWEIRCICLGDMNYRVENEGFAGWVRADGHATELDFNTLVDLGRYLKTPVGYKVAALISSVRTFLEGYAANRTPEAFQALEEDIGILSDEYLKLRYDFLVQVEQRLRQDVPVFQPKRKS